MLMMICLTTSVGALRLTQLLAPHTLPKMPRIWIHLLNQTLVDPHLIRIPSLGALTTRRLARGDFQVLGGQTHGALDAQVLSLGPLDELAADLFERLHLARGQGDADLVDLGRVLLRGLFGVLKGHGCGGWYDEVERWDGGMVVVTRWFQSRLGLWVAVK